MANSKKPTNTGRHAVNKASAEVQQLFAQGFSLHQKGQLPQARAVYEQVLRIQPNHFDATHLLGGIYAQIKDFKQADQWFAKAIAINPDNATVYNNRGNALKELKKLDAALQHYDKALALKPDYTAAYNNRGNIFMELKEPRMALQSYDRAIALKTDYAEAYNNRGNALTEINQLEAALQSYDRAIALKPDHAEAYNNRGNTLNKFNELHEALQSYDKAIALKPDYAAAYTNRGNVFQRLDRLDMALQDYDKAIALRADDAEAYNNRGNILKELKQFDAALWNYQKAIELNPDYAGAHWNISLLNLQSGNFDIGWKCYEWRWKKDDATHLIDRNIFSKPLWLGDAPLDNKTILLHAEQGLGDTIQFCRYARLVAELGAETILQVPRSLVGLLSKLKGVSRIISKDDPLPSFDYQCPLLSLPLAFKTDLQSIPNAGRYLMADTDTLAKWTRRLGEKTKPRIGVVWSGSRTNVKDHDRSILLADFIELLPDKNQYVCLQKEVIDADKQVLEMNPRILRFFDELEDFSDTAALCELMDLVISVDTSVAHLAGALGKSVWILLSYVADWRWMLDRNDSPWYPEVKLYRQAQRGNWKGVFDQVKADMQTFPGNGL